MSTISELKTVVESYLQLAFPGIEEHPLFSQGDESKQAGVFTTLFYQAANNARKYAEKQNDFQFSDVSLVGTIPAGTAGLSLNGLADADATGTFNVKTILATFLVQSDGIYVPIRHESRGRMVHRMIEQEDRRPVDEVHTTLGSKVLVFGNKVYIHPTNLTADTPVAIDANVWMSDYSIAAPTATDEFLTYGSDYMQWACICELNHVIQRFVPRQEGSLPPPYKQRDEALRALIDWDNYRTDANRNIELD